MADTNLNASRPRRRGRPERPVLLVVIAVVATVSVRALPLLAALCVPPLVASLREPRRRRQLARRLVAVLPLIALVSAARVAWTAGVTHVVVLGIATTREALALGAVVALRIASGVLWSTWLVLALTPEELERALARLGVPRALVELVALTRRFGGQLRVTMDTARTAAALRGGFGAPGRTAGTLGLLGGVVIVRALVRAERVGVALALRGDGLLDPARPGVARAEPVPSPLAVRR